MNGYPAQAFVSCRFGEQLTLENDGVIGIPVTLTAYLSARDAEKCPVILYVVGTNAPRYGRTDDETIIRSFLDRGCLVVVTDYLNHEKAVPDGLDLSLQRLRWGMHENKYLTGAEFRGGRFNFVEALIVPAGFNAEIGRVFWEIDKHGADGTLEKIAECWNHDLRGVYGYKEVVWNREKPVTDDFSFDDPDCFLGWVDEEKGTFRTKLKYTYVRDIFDCAAPDGSPIDMKLRMHIIYPDNPEHEVPVFCLAAYESFVYAWSEQESPYLTGFMYRGYAAVIFEYGYTPMARADHYNYFDGWPMPGAVTGDNCTYSINVYNEHKSDTAAIRLLRYLAKTDERFRFDKDAIGVHGLSKSGHTLILCESDPAGYPDIRMFPGHHGETRFENGKTRDEKWVRGGEEQPWLTYPDGTPISSQVDFSIGLGLCPITKGHKPMYMTCSLGEPDGGRYFYMPEVNSCRIYDVPGLFLAVPGLGHDLPTGRDRRYGIDSYRIMYDAAGYWLNHEQPLCLYSDPRDTDEMIDTAEPIHLHFTGPIPEEEIVKTVIETKDGERVKGSFTPSYGKTHWCFMPEYMRGGTEYFIRVPARMRAENGLTLQKPFTARFITRPCEKAAVTDYEPAEMTKTDGPSFTVKDYSVGIRDRYTLRFRVENDAVNTVLLVTESTRGAFHSVRGAFREVRRIRVCGAGVYGTDITELLRAQENFGPMNARLMLLDEPSETTRVIEPDSAHMESGLYAVQSEAVRDGRKVLRTEYFKSNEGRFNGSVFCETLAEAVSVPHLFAEGDLTQAEEGRRYRVEIDYYDTVSRLVRFNVEPIGVRGDHRKMDFKANRYDIFTEKDKWSTFVFESSLDNPMYRDPLFQKNRLSVIVTSTGDRTVLPGNEMCINPLCPFDIGQIRVTELRTGVRLGGDCPLWIEKETLSH